MDSKTISSVHHNDDDHINKVITNNHIVITHNDHVTTHNDHTGDTHDHKRHT